MSVTIERTRLLPGLLAAACLALPGLAVAATETTYLNKSLFWEPYGFDEGVIGLYHLDEQGKKADTDLSLDDLDDKAPLALESKEATGSVRNDHPVGQAGALSGDCAFTANGRFGGGVVLNGKDGQILGGEEGSRNSGTLEFWVNLAEWPKTAATLACCRALKPPVRNPIAVQVLSDGALQLSWYGEAQPPTTNRLVTNVWTHVALTWHWESMKSTATLVMNGSDVARFTRADKDAQLRPLAWCIVGNDAAGKSGIRGTIDEIRFSNQVRPFYRYDLDWPRPAQAFAASPAQPCFRDAADLLFHAGFNKRLTPEVSAPGTAGPALAMTAADEKLTPGKVRALFPDGIEGAALMAGEGSASPVYRGTGNVVAKRGTIAFWLRPLNWDNFFRSSRFGGPQPLSFGLFQIDGEYAPGSYKRNFTRAGPLLEFNIELRMDEGTDNPVNLAPGEWTHIAMTWEGAELTYYVNGQPRQPDGAWHAWLPIYPNEDPTRFKAQPEWWVNAKPEAIRFGNRTYWEQLNIPVPRTAIDDFRVYKRPLAPSEIANLVRLYDPRQAPQPLPVADMIMAYNGVSGRVRAEVTPLGADYKDIASARVQVLQKGVADPIGAGVIAFGDEKQGSVEIKTPPMDFGSFRVTADLQDAAGAKKGSVERTFSRQPPPWWKSLAGKADTIMPDWTPLKVEGNVIKVACRDIKLGSGGLPESIVSVGEDILAGPVALSATSGGQPVPLKPAESLTMGAVNEVQAEARGELRNPDFTVSVASRTEFDGMMWFTLTLTPAPGRQPELDSMTLTVPYGASSSELIHWWSGDRDFRNPRAVHIGALPAGNGDLFRSNNTNILVKVTEQRGSFIPYLLLTGNKRGMAWFAENDSGWTQSDAIPAVAVEREGSVVSLKLRLITAPVKLDAPRTIAFGFHPTPVKVRDSLWRQFPGYSNVYPDTFCGHNLKGRKGPTSFYLYPEDDWEGVKRRIDGENLPIGVAGMKNLYAGQLAKFKKDGIPDPPPQALTVPGLYWDMQWNGIPPMEHTREWTETWALNYQYYTPAFVDFASWCWEQWIVKTDKFVQGAYIDDCWGAPITREDGPCTYKLADGHVQPGFQFLGPRERFKRMRRISWENGVWPHLTAHTTHTFFVPYHSFFDLILDGEDFYSEPASQTDFIDHWPLERMRFMNSEKWGQVTTWLGWCGNSLKTDNWPAWTFRQQRAYVANLALHDIMWGFDEKVVTDFGLGKPDTGFVPYWNQQRVVSPDLPGIKVCAWTRPGKALVLLVNTGTNRVEAAVKPDRQVLGFGAGSATELKVADVDPALLTYFEDDVTTMKAPAGPEVDGDMKKKDKALEDLTVEENEADLPVAERKAKDPDGVFSWKDGALSCPIRRHDFRLFLFTKD